jgi:hypothetical protein
MLPFLLNIQIQENPPKDHTYCEDHSDISSVHNFQEVSNFSSINKTREKLRKMHNALQSIFQVTINLFFPIQIQEHSLPVCHDSHDPHSSVAF